MVSSVQKSLQEFQAKARSTLRDVLSTGLRTCEDAQEVEESAVPAAPGVTKLKFKPRVWGDAHFNVQVDWMIGGRKIAADQTCDELGGCIVISAHYKNQSLPISVEWSRAYNGILLGDIPGAGTSCSVTADEAGCVLRAKVTARRGANLGQAYVEVGPFDMDVSMKQALQNYLECKQASFSVDAAGGEKLHLYITADAVTLKGTDWVAGDEIRSCASTAQVDINDCTVLTVTLKGKPFRLHTMTQRQRDTIVLTVRVFQALKTCEFQTLMEQVLRNTHNRHGDEDMEAGIDLLVILEAMAMQAVTAMEYGNQAKSDMELAIKERDSLEQDINETLESYRALINESMASKNIDLETLSRHASSLEQQASKDTRINVIKTELKECEAKRDAYLKELEEKRSQLTKLQQRLAEKDEQLKLWMNTPSSPAIEGGNTTYRAANALVHGDQSALIRESPPTRSDFVDAEQARHDMARTVDQLKSQLTTLQAENDEAKRNNVYLRKRLDGEQARARQSEVSGTGSNSKHLETITQAKNKEIEVHQLKMEGMQKTLTGLEKEIARLTAAEQKLQSENARLREQTFTQLNRTSYPHGHEATVRDMDTSLLTKTVALPPCAECLRLNAECSRLTAECARLQSANQQLVARLADVTKEKENMTEQVVSLNTEIDTLKARLRKALATPAQGPRVA